ncbi:MAG: hypothetical protein COZ06_02565 [Armatimonadetes bacterium CG_4_10_14_3_um_filter_66_18]|nr:radical SAM protein [Armatimonadota bacterium]PIU93367.1 MAG: hypothetical protein COS65_13125 [Armatimonadetes bacterium CG06_land_8_20_14_3_00_66_21]PIX41832.1 MAG: hypothetical protein COZ57_22565 [Armatimonadetes bacterium CG_4_8_14_3_um_filter_66_20]PIY52798.1 MAG: hypothetical protein COZ06_02565 [Armatimonadetes bacterium CG_4_10_14_3_um_filter_66_18]PIZ34481.1 MAG: hypothetical protein COY42_28565 [Armatimonadetes bacterium CG_4_10_14_0_8_um_filter_66_14]PJB63604.1 MAG: hypothetical
MGDNFLNLHDRLERSHVNGPGARAVLWLQGCRRGCPGCYNLAAQEEGPRLLATPRALWQWVQGLSGIEGVTLSGGEPLLQAGPLADFLELVRQGSSLSTMLYSGYLLEDIPSLPDGERVLGAVDLLVDGPFEEAQPADDGWRGSLNQRIHCLTARYGPQDLVPRQRLEVILRPDGTVLQTGVTAKRFSAP